MKNLFFYFSERMENRKVSSWWREMIQFRENHNETSVDFREYAQKIKKKQDWLVSFAALIDLRCFMGYMSDPETEAQVRMFKSENSIGYYFIYLSLTEFGKFTLAYTYFHTGYGRIFETRLRHNNLEDIMKTIRDRKDVNGNCVCAHPLDRGNALIYRKKVNRKARMGVDLWTLFALTAKIPKDIRLLIAKTIWEIRHEWMC